MKVLVTGSSGRLGKAVIHRLRADGINAIGADIVPGPTTDIILDINCKAEVDQICEKTDAIVHTAALHGKHYDLSYTRRQFLDTNVYGTLNLLEASVKHKTKRFLYISTTSIYGHAMHNDRQAVWVDEHLKEAPRDIYDITKQTAEQLCKDFFDKDGLQTSVYRVARFMEEEPNRQANHRLYRGLDERDGAEALLLALKYSFEKFEIYNIASTSPFTKGDLYRLKTNPKAAILKLYPEAEEVYTSRHWTFPTTIDRLYVVEKAREMLGYTPQYTFEHLLKQHKADNSGL